MKRDMDLARNILLEIEKSTDPDSWVKIEIENYSSSEISYHIKLLHQADLIEANDLSSSGDFDWQVTSLTWFGHEFLDAARNQSNWEKAKQYILTKGGTITLDTLKIALTTLLKQQLGSE